MLVDVSADEWPVVFCNEAWESLTCFQKELSGQGFWKHFMVSALYLCDKTGESLTCFEEKLVARASKALYGKCVLHLRRSWGVPDMLLSHNCDFPQVFIMLVSSLGLSSDLILYGAGGGVCL